MSEAYILAGVILLLGFAMAWGIGSHFKGNRVGALAQVAVILIGATGAALVLLYGTEGPPDKRPRSNVPPTLYKYEP